MFDFAWSEMALIGVVALLLIGPKDMPVAIRTVTGLIKKARKMASEFQTHVDEMVREADLTEARDALGGMRRFNVRNQIMRAIDEDGSLQRTFNDSPLDSRPAAPLVPPPALTPGYDPQGQHRYGYMPPAQPHDEAAFPPVADAGPPPALLPPAVARRLAADRGRLHPPAFLPPVRVIHGARRVAVDGPGAVPPAGEPG
ncbi:Sec-independent protein translocase protein TatB [Gluconacetobacter takamatsuzukensis]|uniref:Twin-arginine translocase subunit TatB n=1 Tax=Gluconacetobacter takamatsuzukensis TaxID=1286190 RepID=A0A7W4KCF8_9PROT|nr:Sec-independent protein translocase protein TatB [Gluconacetobacter takamatsuzukensis]MBB2204378.1 twin-arginine translocase subunit TatB [Gluconacetobacter takamatsuzukensis]